MKKSLSCLVAGFAVVMVGSYVFMDPLLAQQRPARNLDDLFVPAETDSMFVPADTDSFDPGLPVGAQFPPIRARYQGQEITEIDPFVRDKGVVFLANRSVDW